MPTVDTQEEVKYPSTEFRITLILMADGENICEIHALFGAKKPKRRLNYYHGQRSYGMVYD